MLTNDDSDMVANAMCHAIAMSQDVFRQTIHPHGTPSAVYRPRVYKDGDKWCALYGDNIQVGVCGFGETPEKACWDFDEAWTKGR